MRYDSLLDLLRRRRSPYAFDGAPVSDADLARVFVAARWAPSSYNEQPWRFVVGRRDDPFYDAILGALTGHNPTWARTAPVLGLVVVAEAFARAGRENAHGRYDAGAAVMALSLAAQTLELGVHQMAGVEGGAVARALGVPDGFDVAAAFALGRPAPDPAAVVPAELAARAASPKPRRPLADTVFAAWGVPLLADGAPGDGGP